MNERKQIATLPKAEHISNAKNHGRDKETVGIRSLVVLSKGELKEVVDVRFYMGRSNSASKVFCSIWCNNSKQSLSGTGSAGGGGYHKESAAFSDAVSSAGIELSVSVDGVGDRAIDDAMKAIAKALGYRGKSKLITKG
jgi:hypothetical protein